MTAGLAGAMASCAVGPTRGGLGTTTSTTSVPSETPPSETMTVPSQPPVTVSDPPTGIGVADAGASVTTCSGGVPTTATPPRPTGGGLQPTLPATVTVASKAPLPISGGTLLALADGNTVVASDPDRDRLYVVDLVANKSRSIALQAGDEPGRLAQDAAGRVHVALRRGGALVTIDPKTAAVTARRDACAAPRGVTYQSTGDLVLVACASGELVSFPAAGGAATRTVTLGPDLRDVVVDKTGQVYVSTFRKAQVLAVAADGTVASSMTAAAGQTMTIMSPVPEMISPSVAWRMLPSADANGGVVMLHQTGVDSVIDPANGGYAGLKGCPGIVGSVVTSFSASGASGGARQGMGNVTLAVDAAMSSDGTQMALAVPGNAETSGMPTIVIGSTDTMTTMTGVCSSPGGLTASSPPQGEVVAVSFLGATSTVIAQTREPAAIWRSDTETTISLATDSLADTGHTLFHLNAGGGLACASCHPEGGEDGRVWNFVCAGARRTQSIRGGITPTAPFHWDGSEANFSHLMDDVFSGRMAGPTLTSDQKTALQNWVDQIPLLPKARGLDAAAVARGQALFADANVACSSCHAGTLLTNNATVDVGTGSPLQVPSLRGVSWRAPLMHTGCASTLAARFDPACGGGDKHGKTSTLTAAQVGDLVTYLESL